MCYGPYVVSTRFFFFNYTAYSAILKELILLVHADSEQLGVDACIKLFHQFN